MVTCFPNIFFIVKVNPTKTDLQQDVKLANAIKHLVKLCVQILVSGKWVFIHLRNMNDWVDGSKSMPERHQTISQANNCMKHHNDIWYTNVAELSH